MRWIGYGILFLIIALVTLVLIAPLSFVLDRAQARMPALQYASASGSIWSGEVRQLRYGQQSIGNVRLRTDWMSILSGKWKSRVTVYEGALNASGWASYGFNGDMSLEDFSLSGKTSGLVSLRSDIRSMDGELRLRLNTMTIRKSQCLQATGIVWTDVLTRFDQRFEWAGPELDGTVTCENGLIIVRMSGQNDAGETVIGDLSAGLNGTGTFRAVIENPTDKTANAATILGFVTSGNRMVYDYSLSRNENGDNQ